MTATITPRHSESPADDPPSARFSNRTASRLASWKLWLASTTVFMAFAAVFFGTNAPFSVATVESTCGQAPPDVRFSSSATDVNNFLAACGADGRSAYTYMQLADLVYPAVFGLFLATSLALALRSLAPGRPTLARLALLPLLGAAFDYLENVVAWRAIAAFPEPTETDALLGLASAAKTTTFWLAGLLLLGTISAIGVRALRSHARRNRHAATTAGVAGAETA